MTISVGSRKRLWGLSGGKCAVCKETLFFRSEGRDTITGEEAHIISRSVGGPRRDSLTAETRVDDYSNLILLCPRDHKIVDARPESWTVGRLLEVKAAHEGWVSSLPLEQRPVQVIPGNDYWRTSYYPVEDGPTLWRIVGGAHSFRFDHPVDCSEDEQDYLARLFDVIKNWGEMASFMHSRTEERDAERALEHCIQDAMSRSFVLMARRAEMKITGGIGSDTSWYQAEIQAWRPAQLMEALATQHERRKSSSDESSEI